MSIKLDNLSDWQPLSGSIVLLAADDYPRRVRVYLNCMEPTPLFIVRTVTDDEGNPEKLAARFLATMPAGLETLEFVASGDLEIGADHADRVVLYQSTGAEKTWFDGDGESFATIHDRAPRNEALEWVQFQTEQNQRRMEAALRSEMQDQLAAIRSEYEQQSGIYGGEAAKLEKSGKTPLAGKADGKVRPDAGTGKSDFKPVEGSAGDLRQADGEAEE